jgi:flagellar motor component MotA
VIPTLLAVACTLTGTLAGIAIGAALVLPAAHRRVVQRAWTGHDRRH